MPELLRTDASRAAAPATSSTDQRMIKLESGLSQLTDAVNKLIASSSGSSHRASESLPLPAQSSGGKKPTTLVNLMKKFNSDSTGANGSMSVLSERAEKLGVIDSASLEEHGMMMTLTESEASESPIHVLISTTTTAQSQADEIHEIMIDSGASILAADDSQIHLLSNIDYNAPKLQLQLAGRGIISTMGTGTLEMFVTRRGKMIDLPVTVYIVKRLNRPFVLGLKALAANGWSSASAGDKMIIYYGKELLFNFEVGNGTKLYTIRVGIKSSGIIAAATSLRSSRSNINTESIRDHDDEESLADADAYASSIDDKSDECPIEMSPSSEDEKRIMAVHRQFGHRAITYILDLVNAGAIIGEVNLKPSDRYFKCHECNLGKMKRLAFSGDWKFSNTVGRVFHADYIGPFEVQSIGAKVGALVIQCEASRYLAFYPVKDKAEVPSKILFFITQIEALASTQCTTLHCDPAGENSSKAFRKALIARGIELKLNATKHSQHNGLIESRIGEIKSELRTIIHSTGAPAFLWSILGQSICHIYNRTQAPSVTRELTLGLRL